MGKRTMTSGPGASMKATHWSIGYMAQAGESTWSSAASEDYLGGQNTSRTKPIPARSSGALVDGTTGPDHYRTESMSFHPNTSVLSKEFQRRQPAFDRVTACKTNYEVADASGVSATTRFESSTWTAFQTPRKEALTATRRAKANFDVAPPRDPPGLAFNIVTGRYERSFA